MAKATKTDGWAVVHPDMKIDPALIFTDWQAANRWMMDFSVPEQVLVPIEITIVEN